MNEAIISAVTLEVEEQTKNVFSVPESMQKQLLATQALANRYNVKVSKAPTPVHFL